MKNHGVELTIRGEVQKKFSINRTVKIEGELYKKMCDYVKQTEEC
jgi:hypothetical protein